ncbi:MAG TPA: HEAT repeat domain-containing protein [bacterium]|nr:HEAT repeat domain-containing protein [bacterium]
MNPIQVKAIPEDLKTSIPHFAREFKAALSYVSFYSSDSPFVIQAVAKAHRNLQKFQEACGRILLRVQNGKAFLNDAAIADVDDLLKIFQDKGLRGVEFRGGLTPLELASWLKNISLPVSDPHATAADFPHIQPLSRDVEVIVLEVETPKPQPVDSSDFLASLTAPGGKPSFQPVEKPAVVPLAAPADPVASVGKKPIDENFSLRMDMENPLAGAEAKTQEALLSFVAEAWQYSQLQKKNIGAAPEMATLTKSFDQLFDRLLDRMEKTSPEFSNIHQWFSTPQGQLLESQAAVSMIPLVESAVQNGWMAVLFDPATQGLVGECLASWGANGKEELVEKTVSCLAEKLTGDPLEEQLALTHLMDARPWVRNAGLLKKVLDGLNRLLASEIVPGLYQTALLLAWDLLDPALDGGVEEPALNLLSTLHFHADEEAAAFPERPRIARYWLFERSTSDLIRRLVYSASKAGKLKQYPLLGEMAAPLLVEDFLTASATEQSAYPRIFTEMREPLHSALAERLAGAEGEEEVRGLIPILRVCGLDPGVSLQLSAWLSKGSRELKLNLLEVIEEISDPAGGPALRLAVFDDSQEIAAMAARIIGKIRFTPGLLVLLKAAKIREKRYPQNDDFLVAVCRSLGDLGSPEGIAFLEDIARKKPLLWGKNFSLPVRLEAVEALSKINKPQVWTFLGSLMDEKNQPLQETIDRIIHEKMQNL